MGGISNLGLIGTAAAGGGVFAGGTTAAATSSNSAVQTAGVAAATAVAVGGATAGGLAAKKAYEQRAVGDSAGRTEHAGLMQPPGRANTAGSQASEFAASEASAAPASEAGAARPGLVERMRNAVTGSSGHAAQAHDAAPHPEFIPPRL